MKVNIKVSTGTLTIFVPRVVRGKDDELWKVTVFIDGMTPENVRGFLNEVYHPAINVNWNLFQAGEPFWLQDGVNYLICEEVNEEEHTITFRF